MDNKASPRASLAVFLIYAVLIAYPSHTLAQSQIVKKSKSDICHPPESSYYERTRNFRPYETLQACLDSGGRLPANIDVSHSYYHIFVYYRPAHLTSTNFTFLLKKYSRATMGHKIK